MTIDHDGPGFVLEGGLWAGQRLYDLYGRAQTPWAWHAPLFEHARARHLIPFSSPFDTAAVDRLQTLDAPAYKIASFENGDLALIRHAAATGRPLIISTGTATLVEIAEAAETARQAGAQGLLLLHCVSGYPTPVEQAHLRTIPHLTALTGASVGLSDHTAGIAVPVGAVTLGAVAIEKHLKLAGDDEAVDAAFSLDPLAFATMATACREAWQALGTVRTCPLPAELGSRSYRRSLYAVAPIAAGERFTPANVRAIRPGAGLPPRALDLVFQRRAARAIAFGEPLDWAMVGSPASAATADPPDARLPTTAGED